MPTNEIFKLTKIELARLLELSDETISNYVRKGMPVTGKGHAARYNLARCTAWLIDFEADKRVRLGQSGNVTEDDAKVRKLVAEATLKEWEVAELQGRVVRVEDAEHEVTSELQKVRSKLVAIPGTWAARIVGIKDNASATETLENLVFRLMEDLSNDEQNDDEPLEQDGDVETELLEDDEGETTDELIEE